MAVYAYWSVMAVYAYWSVMVVYAYWSVMAVYAYCSVIAAYAYWSVMAVYARSNFVSQRFVSGICPEGFFYERIIGSCYHYVTTSVDIGTAKTACQSLHRKARLVSIDSDAEFDFLRRYSENLYLSGGMSTE